VQFACIEILNAPCLWSRNGLNDMNKGVMVKRLFLPYEVIQASSPGNPRVSLGYTYCGVSPHMSSMLYNQQKWVIQTVGYDRVWYVVHDKYIKVTRRDPNEAETPLARLMLKYPNLGQQPKIARKPSGRKAK
jgi:hypothetical protein